MKLRIRHLFIISFLFACVLIHATNDLSQYILEPLPISEKFRAKSLHRIFQDKEGYIWMGTEDRIYRYDGYKLRQYSTSMQSEADFSDNEVLSFAETQTSIWVGTQQGLKIINKNNYEISDFENKALKGVRINCLMTDSQGNIWIGTQNGLYRFTPLTQTLDVYKYIYQNDNSLTGNGVNYIYEDQNKNIWVAIWDCGLCKYVPSRNNFDRYPNIGSRNNPFRIFQDKDKNYWIATWGDGLFRFYPDETGEKTYKSIEIRKKRDGKKADIFYSIVQDDKNGYLWLVSYTGMFVLTNCVKGEYEELLLPSSPKTSNNLFNEITKDKNGNFWIGTYGNAIYTVNTNKPGIVNYNLNKHKAMLDITPSVNAICDGEGGSLWLSLKRTGIQLYNTKTNIFSKLSFDEKAYHEFGLREDANIIRKIESRKEIWITFNSNYDILALREENGIFKLSSVIKLGVNHDQYPLSENTLSGIMEEQDGDVLVASKGGLYRVKSNNKVQKLDLVSVDHITSMSKDETGTIWLSSNLHGVISVDVNQHVVFYNKTNNKLDTDNIQSVYCQKSGLIWAGGRNGKIYYFSPERNRFLPFFNKINNGEDPVLDIIGDSGNHIWISTNQLIYEIDPTMMTFKTYSQEDGIEINPFNKGAYYKGMSGDIYFGGNNGFCTLPSSDFKGRSNQFSRVYITDVVLQDKSIQDTEYASNFNSEKLTLVLEAWQNNIEINFSSFDYFATSKIEFAYKLEGIDSDWNYVSGDRYFAMYNSLPKGNYTFRIKARNQYGVWDNVCTELKIYKKPHIYETWWAYLFYVLLSIGIAYLIYRNTVNRWRLRNELRIAQIEKNASEQLIQSKLRYFTNVSHELMTPLTTISCLVEDATVEEWQYKSINSNISRLKRLLQQILDFRKVESGNMKLKLQCGDIVSFTKDICDNNFAPLFKEKNISFIFSSSSSPIELYYDPDKVDKILYNLLSNAIKYTSIGGAVEVRVEMPEGDAENNYLKLIVNDNGRGISPEELPNIFNRFFNSKKEKNEYTNGIGLSLTKELVDLHHGRISVESQVDAGTIFIVELPIDISCYSKDEFYSPPLLEEDEDTDPAELQDQLLNENISDKKDVTILIVEDNSELRFILNKILAKNYNTVVAENGKKALEITANQDIDILLSDVAMPEMDGLTLCKKLKENINTSHIPVLLITAYNSIESRVECYNAGADGYLSKPFEQTILDARIKSLIRNRKQKQDVFRKDLDLDVSTLKYSAREEEFLSEVISIIKEEYLNYNELDPDILAGKLNMSRSTLYRKIKSLTDLSPSDFIRSIRLKQACAMLRTTGMSIKEVAFSVGFSDQRYFSVCFKEEFGVTPTEYQKTGITK